MKLSDARIDKFIEEFISDQYVASGKIPLSDILAGWDDLADAAAKQGRKYQAWISAQIEVSKPNDEIEADLEIIKLNNRRNIFARFFTLGSSFYAELQPREAYPKDHFSPLALEDRMKEAILIGKLLDDTIRGIDSDVHKDRAHDKVVGAVLQLRSFLGNGSRKKAKFVKTFSPNDLARVLDGFFHKTLGQTFDSEAEALVRLTLRTPLKKIKLAKTPKP
jgi:hypothetical protein